jgi:hypothetical protein
MTLVGVVRPLRRKVQSIVEALTVGHKELRKVASFWCPGFVKVVVIEKPAIKTRKEISPFSTEPTVFMAKAARRVARARPVKAVKDAVG